MKPNHSSPAKLLALACVVIHLCGCGGAGNSSQDILPSDPEQSSEIPKTWSISELSALGPNSAGAIAINDRGEVAGWAYLSTNARPVVFKNDSIRDLGTLGGNSGAASAINSSGAIAGHSATSDGQTHAFLFRNDEIVNIGEWQTTSQANGMNNNNQVVGFRRVNQYNSFPEAFLYEEGVVRGLGTIEGGYSSSAFSINESGYVTGHSTVMRGSPASHAFIFDGTLMKDLGTLGGANSVGYSINDFNIIVGKSNVSMTNNTERAFMYEDGRMIDLGALDRTDSVAFAVNNRGWVVGTALNQSGPTTLNRGFIYSKSSGMVDLNSLLPAGTPWIIIEARSINSLGQIVGTGVIEGRTRAFLMSPSRM